MINFDPQKVGTYEFLWWKAHNEKNKEALTQNLIKQNIALYELSSKEAQQVLQYLIGAVQYHDKRNWEKATEEMAKYYQIIKDKTGQSFDPNTIGAMEVGWWKLHDELEHIEDKTPLIQTFQELYATLFGLPEEKVLRAAELRSNATQEHDMAEDPSTPQDQVELHWQTTQQLLIKFYQELKNAISRR